MLNAMTTPMPAANPLRSDGLEAQAREKEYFHLLRILPLRMSHGPTWEETLMTRSEPVNAHS